MNSKYLKYAIGEIVLVVFGILIALSINTWNDNRKEQNLSNIYLDRIEQDLHQLINRSESLSEQNRNILEAITTTQTYLERGTPLSNEELETVEYSLLWFPRTTYQLPQMLTYEEMKESGNINLIYQQELRTELAELYSYLTQVESIYVKLGQQVEDQFVIYNRYIRSTTDPSTLDITFEYDFDKMSRDDEFINTFSRLAIHWRGFVFFMEGINQRGDRLIEDYFINNE
ncbi:MAG: hypothetical protein HWD84_09140 [Flavobacteriaceae bacterium]|nr:hypothetical protein [Flavobacteriaceae bacterium]